MSGQRLWENLVIALIGFCASSVYGLDFVGPPRSNLNPGQFGIGLDYTFSDTDLGTFPPIMVRTDAPLHVNKIFATLGYGVLPHMDVYASPGIANASGAGVIPGTIGGVYDGWDLNSGSTEFAWRLGEKTTFFDGEKFKIGGTLSLSHMTSEGQNPPTKIELSEFQIAFGPTVPLSDTVSVYGGLLYRHLAATTSVQFLEINSDLSMDNVGGFMGAQFELNTHASLMAEFQYMEDAVGFSTGFLWRIP